MRDSCAKSRVRSRRRATVCSTIVTCSSVIATRNGAIGIRVLQTPYGAPNANAYAEQFVRSIKEECLDRVIPFGEGHLRRTTAEYVELYHRERNHQGIENMLIAGAPAPGLLGRIRRRPQPLRARSMISRFGRALGQ